jgi:hypothetical protein
VPHSLVVAHLFRPIRGFRRDSRTPVGGSSAGASLLQGIHKPLDAQGLKDL